MVKAIIFDLDDTLLMTSQIRYQAIIDFGKKEYDLEITKSQIHDQWGKPFDDFLINLYKSQEKLPILKQKYIKWLENYKNRAYPNSVSVVNSLMEKYSVGVLSSSTTDLIKRDLNDSGFDVNRFFFIQGAELTEVNKPDPGVFDLIYSKLPDDKIVRSEVVYVGDAITDMMAAKGAGLQFVGVVGRTTPRNAFENNDIQVIKDLSQLLEFF